MESPPTSGPSPLGQPYPILQEMQANTQRLDAVPEASNSRPNGHGLAFEAASADPTVTVNLDVFRDAFRARRRREREGVPFHLDEDDVDVLVRKLTIYEEATLLGFPSDVQEILLRGLSETVLRAEPGTRAPEETLALLQKSSAVTKAVCIAGFVVPRLVATQEEADAADDPAVVWVDDIHPNDRTQYFRFVSGQEDQAARRDDRFPRNGLAGVEGAAADEGGPPAAAAE